MIEEIASMMIYFFPMYIGVMNYLIYKLGRNDLDKILEKFLFLFSIFFSVFIVWNMYSKYVYFLCQWGIWNIIIWISFLWVSYLLFRMFMTGSDIYVAGLSLMLFATEMWEFPIHIQTILFGGGEQLILTFMLSSPYLILIIFVLSILKRYNNRESIYLIFASCLIYLAGIGIFVMYNGNMVLLYENFVRYIMRLGLIGLLLMSIYLGAKRK